MTIITLTPDVAEPYGRGRAPGEETATQLRKSQDNRSVWTHGLAASFKSFWGGHTTRVSKVEKEEKLLGLPRHLRTTPALAKRASHQRHTIVVSGNQPAIPLKPASPPSPTKSQLNATKSTKRTIRQSRERGLI